MSFIGDEIFVSTGEAEDTFTLDNSSSSSLTLLVSFSISSTEADTLKPSLNTLLKVSPRPETVEEISLSLSAIKPS